MDLFCLERWSKKLPFGKKKWVLSSSFSSYRNLGSSVVHYKIIVILVHQNLKIFFPCYNAILEVLWTCLVIWYWINFSFIIIISVPCSQCFLWWCCCGTERIKAHLFNSILVFNVRTDSIRPRTIKKEIIRPCMCHQFFNELIHIMTVTTICALNFSVSMIESYEHF